MKVNTTNEQVRTRVLSFELNFAFRVTTQKYGGSKIFHLNHLSIKTVYYV